MKITLPITGHVFIVVDNSPFIIIVLVLLMKITVPITGHVFIVVDELGAR